MAKTSTVNYQQIARLSGFSLLETLIAVSLLAFVASIAVHMMITTQDSASQSQIHARNTLKRDSLAGYVGYHFRADTLTADEGISDISLSGLPDDLDQDMLQILSVMGSHPRYQNGSARCRLAQDATASPASISFAADCVLSDTNTTLASLIETGWDNDVPVIFGLAGGTAPCESASAPSATGIGEIAGLSVTDAACLVSADNIIAPAGTEIIFPRYMLFDRDQPAFYHRALMENIALPTTGASLIMPAAITAQSGVRISVPDSDLSSLSETLSISLTLTTEQMLASLSFDNGFGAQIEDNNSASVTLTGTIGQIADALDTLHYLSPDAYFGDDLITASARVGVQQIEARTVIDITPNCGDQTAGTAIRFDLGHTEDGVFELVDYVTSVSLLANLPPQRYYGYCNQYHRSDKPRHLYDQDNGLRRLPDPPFSCSGTQDPAAFLDRSFVHASTAIEFDAEDTLTVFIYEETERYTQDRFSLFFIFGDAGNDCNSDPDEAGSNLGKCEADVRLSNLEAGRNLEDITDIFTFADDPGEYAGDDGTATISQTGIITMTPVWNGAHDGLVIPLRIPAQADFGADNLPRLSSYQQDPDNDGNVDPTLELVFADTMHNWRIRAVSEDGSAVIMRELGFGTGTDTERSVISLKISHARACES